MSSTVAVQDLRVGMFVHLDLGWMQHPFPLSSFRIASPDQIATIRGLGVSELRWVPEKSQLDDPDAGPAAPVEASAPVAVAESPEATAARQRLAALAAQRDAQRLLERQYQEAGQALRATFRSAREQPQQARQDAEALSRALLDKLLVDGEMCIRLLSSSAGDRAAAHGLNVAVISLLLGRSFGLTEADMLDLGVGSMLHDLGKIELPDRVRHPDEAFTQAETHLYREHVAHGVRLGRSMGLSTGALAVLGQHHELADGQGFPLRLSGERCSFGARVVALVDRYDNLCNPAVRARVMTPHEALSLLFAQCRSKYDAAVLNAFIRMMGVYPAGSIVQLSDERYALVVAVNSSRPLKPRVLVHDPRTGREDALFLDLEQAAELTIRRSLTAAKLPPAALAYLAPHDRVAYFFEPAPPAARTGIL